MKCRAETVLRDQRTNQVTTIYGELALEAIQSEAALLLLDRFPWFRNAGLKLFFDGQAANCSRELNDNAAEHVYLNGRRGRHEADEYERFEVIVDDADFRLSRALTNGGIYADDLWKRAEASVPDKVFLGDERILADARIAWYAYLGRRAIRVWVSAGALVLLGMAYPSGRRRFPISKVERDFCEPLCDFASGWVERFFSGRDGRMKAEQAGRLRELREKYGVDLSSPSANFRSSAEPNLRLTPVSDGDRGLMLLESRAEEPKRKAPEVFQQIMEETQKRRGVGRL